MRPSLVVPTLHKVVPNVTYRFTSYPTLNIMPGIEVFLGASDRVIMLVCVPTIFGDIYTADVSPVIAANFKMTNF